MEGEYRVRPAVAMIDGNAKKLKIRNLTEYTAYLTFGAGFLNNIPSEGPCSRRDISRSLVDGLNGYFEYTVVIDKDGVGA